jgi:hypothetical protein
MTKRFVAAALGAMLIAAPFTAFAESEGGGPGMQLPIGTQPVHTQHAPVTKAPAAPVWKDGTCNHQLVGKDQCWLHQPTQNGGDNR